ncbi:carbohydrate ABC transporter membrane protein 2, CUT1 family [Friedmanniella luteola]|uniref:Carbohydrate ABC transporter membrane protein 2, CUT1 family n=1 Tax=Friedmanniella luteola TaxID=546871 RepID=A0A1H1XM42_9ACTN|nr:carbohydrate ABC transporter permease [Friedmanniella luteola]SDT09869.1 carbohydrate ABC transporter membrane protein 2, CUT1 family [Friedmanniella luteola]
MTSDLRAAPASAAGPAHPAGSPAPTRRPRRRGSRVTAVVSQTLLSVVALVFLLPIIWMVLSALKSGGEVFTVPPRPFGEHLVFSNFVEAWNFLPFGRFILNTLLVAGLGTVITLVASAMSAYAFARLHFRMREQLFVLYLSTLIVPQEVIVIPMFLIMQRLGWVNTFQGLILPWAFTAFGTFLLRQFFLTIPIELEEAVKIDGAGHVRILTQIIAPIAAPAFAVLAVFTFISFWNSFLWPLIIVNDTSMMTVPLGLQLFLGQQAQRWELLMAAATISMVPTVLLVLVLQKYLVRGIALSGLGGR